MITIASIKRSDIDRIEVFVNTGRKTVKQIAAETGADYAITGTFYNKYWHPVCHLKAGGNILANDKTYQVSGWAWSSPEDFCLAPPAAGWKAPNYMTAIPLIEGGTPIPTLYYNADVSGKRGRTAIYETPDEISLVAFRDSDGGRTPESLRDYLSAKHPRSAVMHDGGGKVNLHTPIVDLMGGQPSQNLILIFTKKPGGCPYKEPTMLVYYSTNGEDAKWLQWQLNRHGADLDVDGIAGVKTIAALREFQKAHGLDCDGICGPATRKTLLTDIPAPEPQEEKPTEIISPAWSWSGALSPFKSAVKYIVIHHAASNGSPEAVHNYHKSLGWCGIAYHLYVRKDGSIYHGRPMDRQGGHCSGYNYCSIGICFEGNFETDIMPAAQKAAGVRAIEYAKSVYPNAKVVAHKVLTATACPGMNFPADLLNC